MKAVLAVTAAVVARGGLLGWGLRVGDTLVAVVVTAAAGGRAGGGGAFSGSLLIMCIWPRPKSGML